jgi:hypothetical protein
VDIDRTNTGARPPRESTTLC